MMRVGRIELPSLAWEASILPLNHTRFYLWTWGESDPRLVHAMDACYHYTTGPSFNFIV